MTLMSLSEKSETRSYGLVSSRVSQVLTNIARSNRLPDQEERNVLLEGLSLLDKFIVGSRLVEGDEFKDGFVPTADTLTAFRYAVTTLRTLQRLRDDEKASSILGSIREFINGVQDAKEPTDIDKPSLDLLKEFFTTLATMLCNDIVRLRFEHRGGKPQSSETSLSYWSVYTVH
jgi:hypothetical protein